MVIGHVAVGHEQFLRCRESPIYIDRPPMAPPTCPAFMEMWKWGDPVGNDAR